MEIRELTKEIRDRSIEYAKPKELDRLSASWYQEDLLYSGKGKTIFLILPTPGCSWALGPSGGCTMCSYISDCYLKPIETDKIIELFEKELNRWPFKEDYENGDKIAIKLFASGSFLNPDELPKEARDYILQKLADMDEISEIVVESRPEYVKMEVLDEIFNIIGDKLFEISIGLETSNEKTRLNKINKGFNNKTFEKAINRRCSITVRQIRFEIYFFSTIQVFKELHLGRRKSKHKFCIVCKHIFHLRCFSICSISKIQIISFHSVQFYRLACMYVGNMRFEICLF